MADVQFASAATLPGTSYYIDELGFLIFLPMPDNQVRIVIKRAGRLPSPRPVPDLQEINVALARFCPEVPPAQALTGPPAPTSITGSPMTICSTISCWQAMLSICSVRLAGRG